MRFREFQAVPRTAALGLVAAISCFLPHGLAAAEPTRLPVRIVGLFSPERVDDLRSLLKEWPEMTAETVDFESAAVVFAFDPEAAFPKTKPDKFLERLDNRLRTLSRGTFAARPPSAVPPEKLERVEFAVTGMDCKGCELAAYESIAKLDGVEQATADFRAGKITAKLDPAKIARPAVEAALTKRGVILKEKAE